MPRGARRGRSVLVAAMVAALTVVTAAAGLAAVVGTPNSGGLVAVGPTSAANGFPGWYTDSNDTTLELCLDGRDPLCGLLPEEGFDPTQPTVFPDNFPGEAFWFLGESTLATSGEGGDGEALVLFGLEAAFSVDEVRDGDQVSFGRIRIRVDTSAAGTYTIEHPYGVDRFEAAAGERAINYTEDVGIGAPGDFTGALNSRVGPFLRWDTGAPAGYVGDPAVAHRVTGSPVGTDFVRIIGPAIGQGSPDQCVGAELPAGVLPADCIYSDLFTIMGKEAVNFGVDALRAVYAGSDGAAAVQVFARSAAGELIQVAEAPGVAATALRGDAAGNFFGTVPVGGPIPDTLTVQNVGDEPVSEKVIDLVDEVVIHNTAYDDAARTLTVDAVSGDPAATLTVTGLGPLDGAGHAVFANVDVPPLEVEVTSSAGGSSRRAPTITAGTTPPPPAPAVGEPTITSTSAGDGTATVTWTAPADAQGVTGYAVQAVDPDRTVVRETTTDATATTATLDGLANGTPYTLRVAAVTAAGPGAFASSAPVTPTAATAEATAPSAPVVGAAAAGDGQATLSWTPPADGGSPITGYTLQAIGPVGTDPVTATVDDPAATSGTVTGLANGTPYRLQVAAVNAVGTGPYSALSGEVTPAAPARVPGAPAIGTAAAGPGGATLTWSAPADDGGSPITGYTVQALGPDGTVAAGTTAAAGATAATVTGLTNGTTYTLRVAATNAAGTGAFSAPSNAVTPATVPGAPTIGTATAANGQATVTWTAPAGDGGSPITGYTVRALGPDGAVAGTATAAATDRSATVTGLTNGTAYTLQVAATNAAGTGASSASSNAVTPMAVPDAPTVTVRSGAVTGFLESWFGLGDASVIAQWSAPAANGSPITGYVVTATGPDGPLPERRLGPEVRTTEFTGLRRDAAYTVTVRAVNGVGAGPTGQGSAPAR